MTLYPRPHHPASPVLTTRVHLPPSPHVTRRWWLFLLSSHLWSSKRSLGCVNSLALRATESGPLPSVFFLSDFAGLSTEWASNLFPPASHQRRGPSAGSQRLSLVPWSAWSPSLPLGTVQCQPVWFPLSFPPALVVAVAVFFQRAFWEFESSTYFITYPGGCDPVWTPAWGRLCGECPG